MLNRKEISDMNDYSSILSACSLSANETQGGNLKVFTPIDGSEIAALSMTKASEMDGIAENAKKAFKEWRNVPAPVRGEFVMLLGQELRDKKEELSQLVTLECGKILSAPKMTTF